MSTYNDHIGKPSKLRISHSGESYKQQFPKRNKSKTVCLQPNCTELTLNDNGYCPRHFRICKCGARVSSQVNRCRPCSIIDSQAARTAGIRKAMAEGRKNKAETREEQLISIIASCDESIANKRHINVCKKTKEDAEKELARIATAKIGI